MTARERYNVSAVVIIEHRPMAVHEENINQNGFFILGDSIRYLTAVIFLDEKKSHYRRAKCKNAGWPY